MEIVTWRNDKIKKLSEMGSLAPICASQSFPSALPASRHVGLARSLPRICIILFFVSSKQVYASGLFTLSEGSASVRQVCSFSRRCLSFGTVHDQQVPPKRQLMRRCPEDDLLGLLGNSYMLTSDCIKNIPLKGCQSTHGISGPYCFFSPVLDLGPIPYSEWYDFHDTLCYVDGSIFNKYDSGWMPVYSATLNKASIIIHSKNHRIKFFDRRL